MARPMHKMIIDYNYEPEAPMRREKHATPESWVAPVFCDRCALLALAVVDGEILCTECIREKILEGAAPKLILPLPLEPVTDSITLTEAFSREEQQPC